MKIKEQTRKLATGCSKHNFEAADKTDEGKVKLTWFEEIFDEYYYKKDLILLLTQSNLFLLLKGSIIFVVGKSPIDIMEPILL